MTQRRRLRLQGVVQGVGMRPFLFGLARRLEVGGLVANDGGGVRVEIEGSPHHLDDFEKHLRQGHPPCARLDAVTVESLAPLGENTFRVQASLPGACGALVAPDLSPCPDCLSELADPSDRRHRYPFLNCAHCGPRFTIIRAVPYDRAHTTLADFPLCPACAEEYANPLDRRFHAQPIACPQCGPQLQWWFEGRPWPGEEALEQAAQLLREGGIVAIQGLGGYHLACDARNPQAVSRLRALKHRPHQPLAVMAGDLSALESVAELREEDRLLLESRQRPIVLVRGRPPWENPILPWLGAMLAYTPLHQLLLSLGPDLLIMTSANPPGAPLEYRHPQPVLPLADAVVCHNRPIEAPCDDSVVFGFRGAPVFLRRARGYVPLPLTMPLDIPPTLAIGAELKNTLALGQGRQAFLSQHLGDLQNLETLEAFERTLEHFRRLFGIHPERVALDLHPGYLGRRWAEKQPLPLLEVQHHHAHLAALMAEHGLPEGEPLLGFCFDGTGYGSDQTLWGGEVLLASYSDFQRLGHLSPMPLVGGEGAIRHPARLALTYLWNSGLDPEGTASEAALSAVQRDLLRRRWQLGHGVPSTSVGRLFDVVASVCGVCQEVTFEGQAALWLEACLDDSAGGRYDLGLPWDTAALLAQVLADVRAGQPPGAISARFHRALAEAVRAQAVALGAERVGLSGGVFQNRYLLEATVNGLEAAGITPLWHRQVPSNDGGLALGQLAVAAARWRDGCV